MMFFGYNKQKHQELDMQIAVNFQNDTIAQKVLWLLEHFQNDGVEVIKLDNTESEVINSFRDGLKEIELVKQGKLTSRPVQDFLNEL
ncbi:MAG: hypothetical protein U9N39_01675 [Campylobacterota bacterium]|nr:hypothetical protein [Campylobacterota bacterium]